MEEQKDAVAVIKKSNGINYSVRKDRHRYFFPDEWIRFIKTFTDEEDELAFNTLLHSGGRIMEVLHLKSTSYDFDRGTISFDVVKARKAKKSYFALGKKRTFFVSLKYLKAVKSFIKKKDLQPNDYLFMDRKELPANYESLNNTAKEKHFIKYKMKYSRMLKSHLKKAGIADWYNFSLHNIRKTYGNWMRLFKDVQEICYRLGHDLETFMSNYGSSLLFNDTDKRKIELIFGEVR